MDTKKPLSAKRPVLEFYCAVCKGWFETWPELQEHKCADLDLYLLNLISSKSTLTVLTPEYLSIDLLLSIAQYPYCIRATLVAAQGIFTVRLRFPEKLDITKD